ncbi:MAG: hypothetical protein H8D22_10155 [Candidatus Cloacimonetes bacterium]|nr:hypothetical protein [Candidatus Cloacimonadota bacterium]
MFYRKKYLKLLRETKDERLNLTLTLNQLRAQVNMLNDKIRRRDMQIKTLKDNKIKRSSRV